MNETLPTIRAVVSFPPGLDETRLAVVDGDAVVAEQVWRPGDNYRPGPATWDWRLNVLGYARSSAWQLDALGFGCNVERITRESVDT